MNTVERISKFESILSIPDMDMRSLVSAKKIFRGYREERVIENCVFEDDVWHLCDEYSRYNFDFRITVDEDVYKRQHSGYYCHRQGNAHRAGPAALRASENRYHHALCNGETAECEAGT